MAQRNEAPTGASLSKEMESAAQLTGLRLDAAQKAQMWGYLKRNCETLLRLYQFEDTEEPVRKFLKRGVETASQRLIDLDATVSGYDEILAVWTAKIREAYLGDETL